MEWFLVNLSNGIAFGMILFLIGTGFSLTLGTMGILNLLHGAFFMIGGFVGYNLVNDGMNFWLAALVGAIAGGVIGLFVERVFLRRLYKLFDEQMLLTLGLVYVAGNATLWAGGSIGRMLDPPSFLARLVDFGVFAFPAYRMTLIGFGIVAFVGIWWLVEKTRTGAIVRAGMDDKQMAMGLGVNYGLMCSVVFALGTFAGALVGTLGTPIIGVVYYMSMDILMYGVVVTIVGGVGSVTGTLIGALLIGIIDVFGKALFPQLANFTIYIVMIIILLVRPHGIMGKKV